MFGYSRTNVIVFLSLGVLIGSVSCAKHHTGVNEGAAWTDERADVDTRLVRMLDWELYEEVETLADSMLSVGWRDPRLLGQKAAAIGMLGRIDEAIGLFEEAILEDYASCDNHLKFAVLLMREGKTGRAITELKEAKQFCSGVNRVTIFRNLAVGYIKMERPGRAMEEVEKGLLIAPKDPYLLGLKGMLIAPDDPSRAEKLLSIPISSGKQEPEFLFQYGILLINTERYDTAVEVLEQALKLRPADLDIGEALALALVRAQRFEEAEQIYLLLERSGRALPLERARIYMDMSRFEEALELFSRLEPTAEVLDRSAMCLMNLGRIDEAVEKEKEALSIRPDWPVAMNNLAVMHAALGELDEARRLLERVLHLDPDNVTALQNIDRIKRALESAE
jgi:tetratricopeptide (TPR) repeat protein